MKRGVLIKITAAAICLAGLAPILRADILGNGTWTRRPDKTGTVATLIIESAGAGRKLTFKVKVAGGGTSTMVVTSLLDGKDATVFIDGKPSGETMAIRNIDDRHTVNVIKMDGKAFVTQKSELSADGKLITTESTPLLPGAPNSIEYWDKK